MNAPTLTTLSLILSALALIAGVYAVIVGGRARSLRRMFSDQNEQPENLEQIITSIVGKIKSLQNGQTEHKERLAQLQETLGFAIQQVGIVRYNSQADDGGNLSFSLALLDMHRSGVVITSLHGRQQNRIYSKQIVKGASEVPLSEEERDAVFAAIKLPEKKAAKLKPTKLKTKRTPVKP